MPFRRVPSVRGAWLSPGLSATAVSAILSVFLSSLAYGADAVRRPDEAGRVFALMQVSPGHLQRARLLHVPEPRKPEAEEHAASVVPVAASWRDPSPIRGAIMVLLGAACLLLAARGRLLKTA